MNVKKTSFIVPIVLILVLVSPSCQVVYFFMPDHKEEALKTKLKQRKTEKQLKKQQKEAEKQRQKLIRKHYEQQSTTTKEDWKKLEKEARRINKHRRRKFFLWRWLGL